VAPIEALSDTRAGADRASRGVLPAVAVLVGFAVAGWSATRPGELDVARATAMGAGALLGFVGLALLSRWIVVPFTRLVGHPVVRMVGVTARLGIGNAGRQPSRTAGAASTLIVGLSLVGLVATFGASAHRAIDAQVGPSNRADLYVERRGVVRVSTAAVDRRLRFRRGVADAVELSAVDGVLAGVDGASSPAMAADPSAAARIIDLGVTAGDASGADASRGGAMVSADTAELLGVGVGDDVTLRSVSGSARRVPVTTIYANTAIAGPAIVPMAVARELSADGTFELAAVRLWPGAPVDRVRDLLERDMGTFPKVAVDTLAQFAGHSASVTDTTLRIVGVLLAGSLGIGVLGLASTLALSTVERRRELVMLRAVGASPLQIRALVWLEATMIGLIAAVVGLGSGIVAGRVGVGVAPGTLGGVPAIPWLDLAVVALGSVVVAWAVSGGVARGAARVPPAEAGRV
jgi:putative ABC transport system permease protein